MTCLQEDLLVDYGTAYSISPQAPETIERGSDERVLEVMMLDEDGSNCGV